MFDGIYGRILWWFVFFWLGFTLASVYVVFPLIDLENNLWFSRLVSLMKVFNFCIKKLALKAIVSVVIKAENYKLD